MLWRPAPHRDSLDTRNLCQLFLQVMVMMVTEMIMMGIMGIMMIVRMMMVIRMWWWRW